MTAAENIKEGFVLPKRNIWADYLFRPLVLTLMIVCLTVSIIRLGQSLRPGWGGGFLILVSGLTALILPGDVPAGASMLAGPGGLAAGTADFAAPPFSGLAANVLLYFVLGLAMLSQVRLVTLLAHWQLQKARVAEGLGKQWAKYALFFLGLIALIAFFLPTGYSLGLLDSTGWP